MPTLIGITWIVLSAAAGVSSWIIARHSIHSPLLPATLGERWILAIVVVVSLAIGGALAWRHTPWLQGLVLLVVMMLLVAISLTDWWSRRIPDALNLALFACALAQTVLLRIPTFNASFLGLLVSGGLFLLLAVIGRGAMGMGDVKLAAVLGALLGFPLVLIALFAGIISGGVAAVGLVVAGRGKRGSTMAYGPYLALGG
ncbi:MAG: A24 family peptidase, partial [Chloroflexi bacterium]|nr:A24 family peptidase [Chloroflexota bacterium]